MQAKVLDLSFSQIPDPDWVQRRVQEGVVAIFQDVWTGGYASNDILQAVAPVNLRFIREGGAIPCIYTNAAPWRTPRVWYTESLRNAGTMMQDVRRVMVDIEIQAGDNYINPERALEFIQMWERDLPVCTYSADWFVGLWKLLLGDANRVWNGRPYIHARYDGIPDLSVNPPRHPLGPLVGKQYRGSHTIEGVSVDASVMDSSFFKENEMLTAEDIEKIVAEVHGLFEKDTQKTFVRMTGRPEVYILTEDQELVHAVSAEVFSAQEPAWDVTELPKDHSVWKLRTTYPAGVPEELS